MVDYETKREIDDNDSLIIELIDGSLIQSRLFIHDTILLLYFNNLFSCALVLLYKLLNLSHLIIEETTMSPGERINERIILCHF